MGKEKLTVVSLPPLPRLQEESLGWLLITRFFWEAAWMAADTSPALYKPLEYAAGSSQKVTRLAILS